MLSYKQLQYVRIFTYLAKHPEGQLRSEIQSGAGLGVNKRMVKLLVEQMVTLGYLVSQQQRDEPRAPYRYWAGHLREDLYAKAPE